MADTYLDTQLLKAQAFLTDPKNNFEFRTQNYGITNTFLKDAEFTIPELAAMRVSPNRATEALFLTSTAFTVGSTRTCAPTGEVGGSSKVAVNWSTASTEIKLADKPFRNNQVTKDRAFARMLFDAEKALWNSVETAGATYLHTNRTQVNVNSDTLGRNTWKITPDFFMEIAAGDRDMAYNYIQSEMARNNYNDDFYSINSTMWNSHLRYTAAQGAGNSENKDFQYNMPTNFEMAWSNQIAAAGLGNSDRLFIAPKGSLALLTWADPLNKEGRQHANSEWMTMPSMFMPGVTIQVYKYETCQDTSADGGDTQDPVTVYELSFDYSYQKAPLSVANETVIFEYEAKPAA